jgi:hypothetical protein
MFVFDKVVVVVICHSPPQRTLPQTPKRDVARSELAGHMKSEFINGRHEQVLGLEAAHNVGQERHAEPPQMFAGARLVQPLDALGHRDAALHRHRDDDGDARGVWPPRLLAVARMKRIQLPLLLWGWHRRLLQHEAAHVGHVKIPWRCHDARRRLAPVEMQQVVPPICLAEAIDVQTVRFAFTWLPLRPNSFPRLRFQ